MVKIGYLPGYIATVSIGATVISDDASDVSYSLTTDAIGSTKLGAPENTYIPGLQDATLDATLHMSTENAAALNAAYEKTVAVAYVVRPGALGTNDVGQWAGTGIIVSYDPTGSATGEWDVSISLQSTGSITYTSPV